MMNVDQSLLDKKYNDGKRFVIVYGDKIISWSKNSIIGHRQRHTLKKKGYDLSKLKSISIEDLRVEVPTNMSEAAFAAEVKRITDMVNPVTEDEVREVRRIAIDNIMKRDLEDLVTRSIMRKSKELTWSGV